MYISKLTRTGFRQDPHANRDKMGQQPRDSNPGRICRNARHLEGTEIELKASAGRLVITPRKHKYDIDQLVAAITPDNRHAEIDWGAPVGREEW